MDMDKKSAEKLYGSLSPEQKKQIDRILSDKEQTERILNSKEAKELLKKLTEGKG